jgi:hypothetical protein
MPAKRGRAAGQGPASGEAKRARLQSLDEVDAHGPRPDVPDELFILHGPGAYRVRTEQLASLRVTSDPCVAEYARSIRGRMPLIVNAGGCFQGHAFTPKPDEANEVEWRDPPLTKGEKARRDVDPRTLTRHVSDHRYCSPADVLARYAGGEALTPLGRALFVILFLNDLGANKFASVPTDASSTHEREEYARQRQVVGNNLSKMFLLHQAAVPPLPDQGAGPAMLVCLASICSDKTEGAPGATYQASIAGYHDRSRLHALSLHHVRHIQKMVAHFQLEPYFPALTASWPLHEWLPLDLARLRGIDKVGPPRGGVVTAEWLERRRMQVPFDTPWVQRCSMAYPAGERDPNGKPVLVPLVRHGAEERNGSPWLCLDTADAASEHYQEVGRALDAVKAFGGAEAASRESADAAAPGKELATLRIEIAENRKRVQVFKAALATARDSIAELQGECARLATRNLELATALRTSPAASESTHILPDGPSAS